ncbi:GNAT family N-acetyltransferase [Neobacillus kokaensis]|uniref:N-acetyltransferase domain-containing protein n=1 Tax=Neobacillus kokaensis TaxID=2759023 RepID=A0ABQ3NB24_9BACI|nr:GNAT family N-acetyltransferase [Neobacillus kokaensis]GHI01114.1 hypothetical protein AM1BK_46560 [Neobacillus kokaensis]
MENQVLIRIVVDSDIPELEKHMTNGPLDKHRDRYKKQLQGDVTYIAAYWNEKPVGHVLLKWNGTKDEAVTAHINHCPDIEDLLVTDEYRNKGIGQQLLYYCAKLTKQRGFERIGLGVGIENESAKRLYQRLGFQDSGIGEYQIGGTFIDEKGIEHSWKETCIYLIHKLKDL